MMNQNSTYRDQKTKTAKSFTLSRKILANLSFILSTVLFLIAISILIRILLPSQILTIRVLAASAVILAGILLLSKEMGTFGENLASLGKTVLNYNIWSQNYTVVFATATFDLTQQADIRCNLTVNTLFSKLIITITEDQFHYMCLGYCSFMKKNNEKVISFWGKKKIDSNTATFEMKIQSYYSKITLEVISSEEAKQRTMITSES